MENDGQVGVPSSNSDTKECRIKRAEVARRPEISVREESLYKAG